MVKLSRRGLLRSLLITPVLKVLPPVYSSNRPSLVKSTPMTVADMRRACAVLKSRQLPFDGKYILGFIHPDRIAEYRRDGFTF